MKRALVITAVLTGIGAGVVPAMADTSSIPLPTLNNRYVCVMTQEQPKEQGICVWAPLPVAPQQ